MLTNMTRVTRLGTVDAQSLVEEEFDKNMFENANWRPHSVVHGILEEYMQRRIASGDIVGEPMQLALVFLGSIFAQVIGAEKFPIEHIYGSREAGLRYFVNVFLNGVRSK